MENRNQVVHSCKSDVRASRRLSLGAIFAHLLAIVVCLTATAAAADELSLLINGKAIHLGSSSGSNLNEKNWGLGLQYDWDRESDKWRPFATVSEFRDSNYNTSYYAGGGALYRFQFDRAHVDLGAVGFVMVRKDYKNGDPFLGVLPALSVGTKNVALNITYIPKIEPKAVPLWFFQLKINLASFR
jgi:hypothetical protein